MCIPYEGYLDAHFASRRGANSTYLLASCRPVQYHGALGCTWLGLQVAGRLGRRCCCTYARAALPRLLFPLAVEGAPPTPAGWNAYVREPREIDERSSIVRA